MLSERDLKDSYQIGPLVNDQVRFDVDAFDRLIKGQGVRFRHFRAMPCPVGLGDRYDVRKVHDDHSGCSNGFLYHYAGEVVCTFSGNGKQVQLIDAGLLTGATVQVTVPRFYDDKPSEEVLITVFDRFYLAEDKAYVIGMQRFEANATGKDRMNYPVAKVEAIVDSDGKLYDKSDYTVEDGQIVWTGYSRPGIDPQSRKGQICSIRYRYKPFWYCKDLLHEVRVVQAIDPITGLAGTVRMPYAALLQREYVFENEQRDDRAPNPDSPRQPTTPRSGSFGPR